MSVRALLAALAAEVVAFGMVGIVIIDLRLHDRFEQVAGVNVQGYRGPIQPHRVPGERRLLLVGDSTAFGYGVAWTESFPSYLTNRLRVERNRIVPNRVVRLINAASIPGGAFAFRYAIRDFKYVVPDIIVVDAGYDALCDECTGDRRVWRHESALFLATGYMPMLPLYLQEKGVILANAPSGARRLIGHVFGFAARAIAAADRPPRPDAPLDAVLDVGCGPRWTAYCAAIQVAVTDALSYAKGVVVITPPFASDRHREQQQAMAEMLRREFGRDGRVVYLDHGTAVDLHDPELSFDGVHLTSRGNQHLAESLMPPLRALLDRW